MHDATTHVYVKAVELGFYSQSNLSDKDKVTFPLADASLPVEAGSNIDSSEAGAPSVPVRIAQSSQELAQASCGLVRTHLSTPATKTAAELKDHSDRGDAAAGFGQSSMISGFSLHQCQKV